MSVRLWAFFLLGFHLAACFPFGWLVRQLGGLPPIFSLTFSFGVVSLHGSWSGFCRGSPLRVVSSCSFLEGNLPPLWRWRVWMAESSRPLRSSGRLPGACSNLSSSPLALHGVVSASPVCLSRAPAFRQVRVAMLTEGSWNRPRSWCWLSIRLSSWWKGRLMGQLLVIVPLPWTAVFIHSVFS